MNRVTAKAKIKTTVQEKVEHNSFPVVAIGASAGGLEAVKELLLNLPVNTGMAFIYVQHLSPDHKSILTSLLSKATLMKVQDVKNKMLIEPNNLYVIPPDKEMIVIDGHIKLTPRPKGYVVNLPIDIFFASLAEKHKDSAIGIILSGNASDGTRGLRAIKDVGGLTFAQDDSAKFSSMPKSAIAAGAADFILSPKEIALELSRLSKSKYAKPALLAFGKEDEIENTDPNLKTILDLLYKETDVDFSHYKMATIKRRILRRMLLYKIKTLKEYAKTVAKKPDEINILYQDLLINVTSFFRELDAHHYLKTVLFPRMLKSKGAGETFRIWIPACSTGEEAYSIAMILLEIQGSKVNPIPIKIFATDLSTQAIARARTGEYARPELESVSPKRLQRFYTKTGNIYRIAKVVRDMCIFTPHNILRDPPFSHVDFISCCNLLIYLDAMAQKKTIATFHYALNPSGYLMLSKSETIGTSGHLFSSINKKFKIYLRKKNAGAKTLPQLAPHFTNMQPSKNTAAKITKIEPVSVNGFNKTIDEVVLSRFMPAGVVVNYALDILQFRGPTDLFLKHPPGRASLNILKMIPPEIAFELRAAVTKAIKTKQAVHKSGIEIKVDTFIRLVSMEIIPLVIEWEEPLLLIIFTQPEQVETFIQKNKGGKSASLLKDRRIKKLEEELSATRDHLQAFTHEQETLNQELQSANEEVVSSNEELQSVNEELETSKEEIESSNEELITTNQALQTRNDLLNESYEYSEAIIANMHEPLIILNKNFLVKSANNSFYKNFRVSPEETVGTQLYALGNEQWNIPKLRGLLDAIVTKNTYIHNFEVTHTFPLIGKKIMLLNARRLVQQNHGEQLILLAINDITERAQIQLKEKEIHQRDIKESKSYSLKLEKAVSERTKELAKANAELSVQNKEKEKRAAELAVANKELAFQNDEKEKRAAELVVANKELAFQNDEKEKRGSELIIANTELVFQNEEKGKRADELIVANSELAFQNEEKEKRGSELIIANSELAFQNNEKEKRAAELVIANTELAFQNDEKEKRGSELIIANSELAFQNDEKEKRADELIIANNELAFQNEEKEKRAAELIIANNELAFQNEEKEKRAAELLFANKELESFTYIASHDLQEPLRKIQTFAGRILEKETLSDTGTDHFQRIQAAAARMQQLIVDLLAYSLNSTADRKFEKTDLGAIIEEIKADLKEAIDAKHATVIARDLCEIKIIVFQFRQLMYNLISNSLKFADTKRALRIVIKSEIVRGEKLNKLTLSPEKKYCHISVSDNGIGFEPRYAEKIFVVFQRLHNKEDYEGTGIGLSIVKKIVENHGGVIIATGELGKGATFDIYIPV